MILAVEGSNPDLRREAVVTVAESDARNEPLAIDGFVAIARVEADPRVRCAAIRALREVADPAVVDTLVRIVDYDRRARPEVRRPTIDVRREATAALVHWLDKPALAGERERRQSVRDALLIALRDNNYHARAEAARGLANFPHDRTVLESLIRALDDDKFTVVYAADQSLEAITGVTQPASQRVWREWYRDHRGDPFAAQEADEPERAWYDLRQVFD
jgi:HEAT repeat protein